MTVECWDNLKAVWSVEKSAEELDEKRAIQLAYLMVFLMDERLVEKSEDQMEKR